MKFSERVMQFVHTFRSSLAYQDALPQLAALGILAGILTGLCIAAFRLTIEVPMRIWLGGNGAFETLGPALRFFLPIIGAALIVALLIAQRRAHRQVGVVHVMRSLADRQGRLPFANAANQFIGGAIALLSGHSVGREGPAIHLGAWVSSFLGQRLRLPNNALRTLASCGTAAAISASFNTPMAGVIFSMEVLAMHYTTTSFVPVILAAVSANIITVAILGEHSAIVVPTELALTSLWEYPFAALEGALIGLLAVLFIVTFRWASRQRPDNLALRLMAAGLLTGTVAVIFPQIMGIGYDTLNNALLGELALATFLVLAIIKLLVSATVVGLGVPGGIIGPTLVTGGLAGAAIGLVGQTWILPPGTQDGLYVTMGMAAMMGAVLQAPLAALVVVLELTERTEVIVPAMLAIITATLVSRSLGRQSIFLDTLSELGLRYATDPVTQHLQGVGAASAMNRNFALLPRETTAEEAVATATGVQWIVVDADTGTMSLMPAAEVTQALTTQANPDESATAKGSPVPVDLLTLGVTRLEAATLNERATLLQVQQMMTRSGTDAVILRRVTSPTIAPVSGILTRADLEVQLRQGGGG